MIEAEASSRLIVTRDCCPRLSRHVRLVQDNMRGRWLILAPERVFNLEDTAIDVVKLVNGRRSVCEIAAVLAQDFDAPFDVIAKDIMGLLQDLADRGALEVARTAV